MTTVTKTSHIDKFNGTDFPIRKKQVFIALKVRKLDKVVDGSYLCPIQQVDDFGNPTLRADGIPT